MNERIRELARQANFTEQDIEDMSPGFEKFAELMIKEFETVAKQPPHYYDAASCGWRNPINYVCKSIKEHFGVE